MNTFPTYLRTVRSNELFLAIFFPVSVVDLLQKLVEISPHRHDDDSEGITRKRRWTSIQKAIIWQLGAPHHRLRVRKVCALCNGSGIMQLDNWKIGFF